MRGVSVNKLQLDPACRHFHGLDCNNVWLVYIEVEWRYKGAGRSRPAYGLRSGIGRNQVIVQ